MAALPPILCVIGPTASGKSELAVHLARRTEAEILSVDSMQVYQQMDIGTAKTSPAERAALRHHLIDVVPPSEIFTAARFVELAEQAIADARQRNVPLIAVGGTPLYFKALFEGLFAGPGASSEIRQRLKELPNEELYRRVGEADPAAAQRIHLNDTKRLIRVLEIFELTGQPITTLQGQWSEPARHRAATWVGVHWDREILNRRINARVMAMIEAGWVQEVKTLLAHYGELSRTAAEATGYRELIEHLHGELSLNDAIEQIKIATRQLARKQMKWFRRFPQVKWLEGNLDVQDLTEAAQELWIQ